MPDSSSPAGDAESSSGLMLAIRKFFDPDHGERSLRAQLEEAIDEHEGENGEEAPENSGTGDLSLVERQMLRQQLEQKELEASREPSPNPAALASPARLGGGGLHGHEDSALGA